MAAIADRLVALVWVIVGIVVVIAAGDISSGGSNALDGLGPKVFPQAMGTMLAILGLWLLLSDSIARLIGWGGDGAKQTPSPPSPSLGDAAEAVEAAPGSVVLPWRVVLSIVISVGYVALLPVIHYVAATLLASVAMMVLLGARRLSLLIIYPVVLTFSAQYAFTEVVGVILP